jgi:formylglycine-generating enzyme required for sulfatase activity
VPATGLAAYFTAPVWCNFENIIGDAVEPTAISISLDSIGIYLDHQFQLNATIIPANTTTPDIVWISTNNYIATVKDGLVSAIDLGECDIIAYSLYGYKAICHVSVTEEKAIINLDQHEAMVLPNHMLTIIPTVTPTSADLIVTSSDPTVAAARFVNGKIQVVGIKEGSATITVTTPNGNAQPDSCLVTVYTEKGDLNCDGFINISDVTAMIDYLLSGDGSNLKIENADVNKDNGVNISDVTTLIDYLLSGSWPWQHDRTFEVKGVSFKMKYIERGTFTMGATNEQSGDYSSDEMPTHKVALSDFSIGETEVTQALWTAVMGSNPSYFSPNNSYTYTRTRPVENVSWNDCQTFITRLNELTGMTFRLPTEAEWEFASRGGNLSMGYKYAGSNSIGEVAWWQNNSYSNEIGFGYSTHIVATKLPNELGLYDMSGNVSEWCEDWYDSYSGSSQANPMGPSTGTYRICRGGSWVSPYIQCRVSKRGYSEPTSKSYGLGLRLAL